MWVYYIVFYKWYREKDNKIVLASSFFIQLHYAQNETNSFFFNYPRKNIMVKKAVE